MLVRDIIESLNSGKQMNKLEIDEMINTSLKKEDILNASMQDADVSPVQKHASYNKIVKLLDKLHTIAENIEK